MFRMVWCAVAHEGDRVVPILEITIRYWMVAVVPEGPILFLPFISLSPSRRQFLGDWMLYPPYADGEDNVVGEQPAIWCMEFFVTRSIC